jgi:hypothetical protein
MFHPSVDPDDDDASETDNSAKRTRNDNSTDRNEDSDIPPFGTNIPPFEELSGDLRLKMEAQLQKRQHASDPNSFKSHQLQSIIASLSANRSILTRYAAQLDKKRALGGGFTLASLLRGRIAKNAKKIQWQRGCRSSH